MFGNMKCTKVTKIKSIAVILGFLCFCILLSSFGGTPLQAFSCLSTGRCIRHILTKFPNVIHIIHELHESIDDANNLSFILLKGLSVIASG